MFARVGPWLLQRATCPQCARLLSSSPHKRQQQSIFDRRAKLLQKERAAANPLVGDYDFLKEEIGYRVSDRVLDIARKMDVAVDIGSGRGFVTRHLTDHSVGRATAVEMSPGQLSAAPDPEGVPLERICLDVDGTDLPFSDSSVDIVTSSLALHWVNDLPRLFREINRILKPDGVFIGAMFGGETLYELRVALQLAETEREGGIAPHISPFVEVRDLGSLLNASRFTMITIDTEELKVGYPTIFQLMRDLKGMAESNAAYNRKLHLRRETLVAANAIYKELYQNEDQSLPATFQIFYWIGWKPDASQPRPLAPQKSDISLKDLHKLEEIVQQRGFADVPPEKEK